MKIEIVSGIGTGKTKLGSFDSALTEAGIHNYNIVELSSVVPEGAIVEVTGTHNEYYDVGSIIGAVLAERTGSEPGELLSAGLGWVRAEQGGLFFEQEAPTEEACKERLEASLTDCQNNRPSWAWEERKTEIVSTQVESDVKTVLVAALFGPFEMDWESMYGEYRAMEE